MSSLPKKEALVIQLYYVEELNDTLEKGCCKLIYEIENLGGAVSAIEKGFQQNQISESAYEF